MDLKLVLLLWISVVIAATSGCDLDADCPQDQCCGHATVTDLLGLGRSCKPYAGEGEACHGSLLSSSCDCHEGLVCVEYTGLGSLLSISNGECRETGTNTTQAPGLLSSLTSLFG